VKPLLRYRDLTIFKNGGRPPSWTCWSRIWSTLADRLVVLIVVQNLVAIDPVVSVI